MKLDRAAAAAVTVGRQHAAVRGRPFRRRQSHRSAPLAPSRFSLALLSEASSQASLSQSCQVLAQLRQLEASSPARGSYHAGSQWRTQKAQVFPHAQGVRVFVRRDSFSRSACKGHCVISLVFRKRVLWHE